MLFEVAVPEPTEGLDELDGPGVDDLLLELLVRDEPKPVGAPILYDCEIFVQETWLEKVIDSESHGQPHIIVG